MAFSSQNYHILVLGPADNKLNCTSPILNRNIVTKLRGHTLQDFADNFLTVLGSRIVIRNYQKIREIAGDLTHFRSFSTISVAAATEDNQKPAVSLNGDILERFQHIFEAVRRVGVIDQDHERLAFVDVFHAPARRRTGRQCVFDMMLGNTNMAKRTGGRLDIQKIEIAQKPGLEIDRGIFKGLWINFMGATVIHKIQFCFLIIFEGFMVIEMILSNIRQDFDVEIDA